MTEIRINAAPEPNIAQISRSDLDASVRSLPLVGVRAEPGSRPDFTPVDRCESLAEATCERSFIRKSN